MSLHYIFESNCNGKCNTVSDSYSNKTSLLLNNRHIWYCVCLCTVHLKLKLHTTVPATSHGGFKFQLTSLVTVLRVFDLNRYDNLIGWIADGCPGGRGLYGQDSITWQRRSDVLQVHPLWQPFKKQRVSVCLSLLNFSQIVCITKTVHTIGLHSNYKESHRNVFLSDNVLVFPGEAPWNRSMIILLFFMISL